MQCTRMFSFRKAALPLVLKTDCQCASVNGTNLLGRWMYYPPFGNVQTKHFSKASLVRQAELAGPFKKPLFGFIDKNKYRLMALGALVYENIADKINYQSFYTEFNMADTLFSWFLVTELHVWMAMLRYMAEGNDGKIVRNNMVEAMWLDTQTRLEHLGSIRSSVKRKQLTELSAQFNAAVIGYDEGILSDDKVLASALWRRFFHYECNNPEHLERLLIYVRKQVNLLDKISSQQIIAAPFSKWLDLRSIR